MRVRVPVGSLWQYWWSTYSDILQVIIQLLFVCVSHRIFSEDGILVATCRQESLIRSKLWWTLYIAVQRALHACCQVYYIWWSWHYCMHWHHYELHNNYYLNKYCEKNNSIIYIRKIRILTMMTVAQLTCTEAYCLWMYVIVVYLQLVIDMIALGHSCIPGNLYWVALHFTVSFFGILDQFQHCFSQTLVFPWLIVDMCWDSHIKFALDSLNRYL